MIENPAADVYSQSGLYTSEQVMRTNIDIDEDLIQEAMTLTGQKTKKSGGRRKPQTFDPVGKTEKIS